MGEIETTTFWKDKYGRELLIDLTTIAEIPTFILDATPHRLQFYEILFIESGTGIVLVDEQECHLVTGSVLFTAPLQVRRWSEANSLAGLVLFFTDDFLADSLVDTDFFRSLSFFGEGQPLLNLPGVEFEETVRYLQAMKAELPQLRSDSAKVLAADLYRQLVRFDRAYRSANDLIPARRDPEYLKNFRTLIEENFAKRLPVSEYARYLGITAGHLNDLCLNSSGATASELIQSRVLIEARRLLTHTGLSISEIGHRLGFYDPAHFGRYFKTRTGMTPGKFREADDSHTKESLI